MRLLFKQRFFSWFDSYDIYDEAGKAIYTVRRELTWGSPLRIYDTSGNELGHIRKKPLSHLPRYEIFLGSRCIGCVFKVFTFHDHKYKIDYKGWQLKGDWFDWEYTIYNDDGKNVAAVSKKVSHFICTYTIDVCDPRDALCVLLLVLAKINV